MYKGMLVSFTEINKENEDELKSWFVNEHIDERAINTEGFFRSRLYECLDNGPKFFATYETTSFDILSSNNYMSKVSNQTKWSKEIIPKLTMLDRLTGKVTIDKMRGYGGNIIVFRFLPLEMRENRDNLRKIFRTEFDQIIKLKFINGICLIENDSKVSTSTGKKAENIGGNPNLNIKDEWLVIIEGQDDLKLKNSFDRIFNKKIIEDNLGKKISTNSYRLIYGNNR
tara:strand:+ start:26305 stop:26985 length:681 start_codon:yes stop_codon:yes gene_type:complete